MNATDSTGEQPLFAMADTVGELKEDLDIFWIIVAAIIVFFMQAGFTMLEAGTITKDHFIRLILYKNVMDACICALVWYTWGYPIAFGDGKDAARFSGRDDFVFHDATSGDAFSYADWFYTYTFAATSGTIISGAVAERCKLRAYAIATVVSAGLTYPLVAHWVWSDDGWLSVDADNVFEGTRGFYDFSGSTVVHVTGGVAALFAAYFLGPRKEALKNEAQTPNEAKNQTWAQTNLKLKTVTARDPSIITLGVFILWFTWYAFNATSGKCVHDCMVTATLSAVNTTLSAASGGITIMLLWGFLNSKGVTKMVDLSPLANGVLAGLVGITAGSTLVEPFAAIIIGTLSALAYSGFAFGLKVIGIDDPLEASAVHFPPGAIGTILVGFFATKTNVLRAYNIAESENESSDDFDYGVFYGGSGKQLGIQILGVSVAFLWSAAINFVLWGVLHKFNWLRDNYDPNENGQRDRQDQNGPSETELQDRVGSSRQTL